MAKSNYQALPAPEQSTTPPVVSVVIVSDYLDGEVKAWDQMRTALAALARQDFADPTEFLLSECVDRREKIPPDLTTILPSLKVVLSSASSSFALKNEGVQAASADIVAILDADCTPDSSWLRNLVDALRSHPNVVAVSGRTVYVGKSRLERILALLSRSFLDPGRTGRTQFIANNNAGFRRATFLTHPLPIEGGPFAARIQSEAILRSGGQLLFEPRMHMAHEFTGWVQEKDIRCNMGYATIAMRLRDRSLPYAKLARLGYVAIPLFVTGKILNSWADSIRCGRHYGLQRYELPVAFGLAIIVRFIEIPGMISALRGQRLIKTNYR